LQLQVQQKQQCEELEKNLMTKKSECDEKQRNVQQHACEHSQILSEGWQKYMAAYQILKDAYELEVNTIVKLREPRRHVEFASLNQTHCVLQLLGAAQSDGDLDNAKLAMKECQGAKQSTDFLNITANKTPAPEACADVPPYPCSSSFAVIAHYPQLPTDAPAKDCKEVSTCEIAHPQCIATETTTTTTHTEASGWKLLAKQNVDNMLFDASARTTFKMNEHDPSSDAYMNIGAEDANIKNKYGKYQFKLVYDDSITLVWEQMSWLTSSTIQGFRCLSPAECGPSWINYGKRFTGLGKSSSNPAVLDGDASEKGGWWNSVGTVSKHNGGIPGWSQQIAKTMELFIGIQVSYRLSNAGLTGWRPEVQLKAYRDAACSDRISDDALSLDACSGFSTYGTQAQVRCENALSSGKWRPQCSQCQPGDAWIEFSSASGIMCITLPGNNLGKGEGGGKSWSGGVTMTASDGSTWVNVEPNKLVMQG